MTPAARGRGKWERTNGAWVLSIGMRGTRVRLYENLKKGGTYYRDVWAGGKKDRRSLQTRDKSEAERRGRALLGALLQEPSPTGVEVLTLGMLWRLFRAESAAHLDNKESTRKDDAHRATVLLAFFGDDKDVSLFTENDQLKFQNARLKGGLVVDAETCTRRVRQRTVAADLRLLHTMLRWATRYRLPSGPRLLKENPLHGVQIPRERNVVRPVATIERFTATRAAIAREMATAVQAEDERARLMWAKLDLALVIAEATGRRIGAIRLLFWSDLRLEGGEAGNFITWRADADKKGVERVTAIPEALAEQIRHGIKQLDAIHTFVFASPRNPHAAISRHLLAYWLQKAERAAGLPPLKGGVWHTYRRKWATERKDYPMKDVMAAGGWTDVTTFLTSYQQVDAATQLRVMSAPEKLSEKVGPGAIPVTPAAEAS
jgi:integrase